MQLSAFSGLDSQLQSLNEKRQIRSGDDYYLGMRALYRAKESEFKDKKALSIATKKLMSAVQKDRKNPAPFVSLGYLLIILGDDLRAEKYLCAALRLEPDNQDALNFLDSLKEVKQLKLKTEDTLKRIETQQDQGASIDYEALCEGLQKLIQQTILEWMGDSFLQVPEIDAEKIAENKIKLEERCSLWSRINKQTKVLDVSIDTSALLFQMRPLEKLLYRYQRNFATSETLFNLLHEINAKKQYALKIYQDVEFRKLDVSESLEQLLDDCDGFADALDSLSECRIDIQSVELLYEDLVALVCGLQDYLDG